MDTMKILLGATVVLLLAAVVLAWQRMREDSRNAPPDEMARVEQQISLLKLEQERLASERELRALRAAAPMVPDDGAAGGAPGATDARIAALEEQLAQTEERLAATADETAKLERDKEVARSEAGLIAQRDLESRDRDLRRARQISQALLIATVQEYVENPEIGSFAVIEIQRPENVQPGTVLDIRRKTGVLGKLVVEEITGSEAIASPVVGSFFEGRVEIQPGDELIVPPPF